MPVANEWVLNSAEISQYYFLDPQSFPWGISKSLTLLGDHLLASSLLTTFPHDYNSSSQFSLL